MANDTDPFLGPIVRLADRDVIYQFIWCSSVFCVLVAILDEPANLLAKGQADAFGSRGMLYSISVTTFYGFVVALYMALYLGGTGWHMELVKWHIAKLTEVSVSTATAKSAGQERWTRQNRLPFLQSFLMCQCLYGLSVCTCKWSMLFMLKRIFPVKCFEVRLRQQTASAINPSCLADDRTIRSFPGSS